MTTGTPARCTTGSTVLDSAYVVTYRNTRSTSARLSACPASSAFGGVSIRPRFTTSTPGRASRAATRAT